MQCSQHIQVLMSTKDCPTSAHGSLLRANWRAADRKPGHFPLARALSGVTGSLLLLPIGSSFDQRLTTSLFYVLSLPSFLYSEQRPWSEGVH